MIRSLAESWRLLITEPSTLKLTVYSVPNRAESVWFSAATMEFS